MSDKVGTDINDSLYGSIGNDTLDGGKGNDLLSGGKGNDTYIFNLGYGKDRIYDVDSTVGNIDAVKFGEGITELQLKFSKVGNDLIINVGNDTDELRVVNYYLDERYKIEQIEFNNGVVWDKGRIAAEIAYSTNTEQGDYIGEKTVAIGTPQDDVLIPNNQDGDNFIDPLAGNDIMRGGKGNDTYIFGVGYGNDTIEDYDPTTGNIDTVRFIKDLARQDVTFSRVGDDLKVSITGTNDVLTISHYFDPSGNYIVEEFKFGDQTVIEGRTQFITALTKEFDLAIATRTKSDPVVLDLDGNGIEISTVDNGVNFDLDNNGFAEKIQWVNDKDGVLVRDLNENGKIDNGTEVFGDQVLMSNGKISTNGYEALRDLDKNNDYILDSNDEAFKTLKIWIDENSDGITDAGELKELSDLGITALNLNKNLVDASTPGVTKQIIGNYQNPEGQTLEMSQFFFNVDLTNTIDLKQLVGVDEKVSSLVRSLPEVSTVGNVYGLRKSMMTNEELRNLVGEFVSNDTFNKQEMLDEILFRWTDTASVPRDSSRGNMDARDLAVVEKFLGRKFVGDRGATATEAQAIHLRKCYVIIKDYIFRNLVAQSYLKEYVKSIECYFNETTMKMEYKFDKFKELCTSRINQANFGYLLNDLLLAYESDSDAVTGIKNVLTELRPLNEQVYIIATAKRVLGRADSETLNGSGEVDLIYGGKGNDYLKGYDGDDYLNGEQGNDTLEGGAGSDTYLFGIGSGRDTINNYDTSSSIDVVKLDAGLTRANINYRRAMNDLEISIVGTNDLILIKNYYINDYYKVDRIEFADGSSLDNEELRNLVLYGTNGNDVLTASDNKETINGLAGDDTIYGLAGDDTIYGAAGNDTIYGGNDNDTIDGGEGKDTLDGGAGNDTYIFRLGSGNDIINENDMTSGNVDTLRFESNIKQEDLDFRRENRNLIITVKSTGENVTIINHFLPGNKIERIEFADGSILDNEFLNKLIIYGTTGIDVINSDNVDEIIDALDGADIINAKGGADKINGRLGNDTIDAGEGDDTVYGDEGDDNILGQAGNDTIFGGIGDDEIYGGAGNDHLDGGEGNDFINGGEGDDTYIFRLGSGVDRINDTDKVAGNLDTLKFEEGINYENVSLKRVNRNLEITINNTSEKVTILNQFLPNSKIEKIEFGDGTLLDNSILDDLIIYGTAIDDNISTDDVGEIIDALDGADTIHSMGGDDSIHGRAGNDNIYGGDGIDTVFGDEGDDYIYGEAGEDILKGGLGNDHIYGGIDRDNLYGEEGNDTIYGQEGNDFIDGGIGNDVLVGGVGDDTYIFGIGSGADTIIDNDSTIGNIDTVELGEGITDANIRYRRDMNNLEISIYETGDKFTIRDYYVNDSNKVEKIQFADGHTLNNDELRNLVLYGTKDNDEIKATDNKEVIDGLGGNDTIYAYDGDDTVYGNDGDDTIDGGSGKDYLDGGRGKDKLIGGVGNDTYIFGIGYGQDVIIDADTTLENADTILLSKEITLDMLDIRRVLNNLEISIKGTEDKLIINNYYLSDSYKIENIKFADGTALDNEMLKVLDIYGTENIDTINTTDGKEVIRSLAGNDIINSYAGDDKVYAGLGDDKVYAGDGNDVIDGEEGNDILQGDNGNDSLIGGLGNDSLYGGAGNDTYIFSLGFGQDTINEIANSQDIDTIKLLQDITKENVIINRILNDLVITIDGTDDKLIVKDQFAGNNKIEKIEFADGSIIDGETLRNLPINGTEGDDIINGEAIKETILGLDGNDTIYGNAGQDNLYGGNGNDKLYGEADDDDIYGGTGNDTLDGGIGNDTLDGGIGNDTYIFNIGYGEDIISDYDVTVGNSDTIKLGVGITEDNIKYARVNEDLILTFGNNTDKLTIKNYFSESNKIENIQLSSGKLIEISNDITIYGTEGDDNFQGEGSNETYIALGGNDVIYGNEGNDTIYGDGGNDSIYGGDGDDKIYGGEGIDTLDGGAGHDHLEGGTGNDTYVFGIGYNEDVISDFDNTDGNIDTLRFSEGIKEEDLIFSRNGYNLEITIKGQSDKLTIEGYYSNDSYRIEKFELFDGTVVDNKKADSLVLYGTDDDDIIIGGDISETIMGLAGNDTIYGQGGNDTIDGGIGNDTMYGGVGNDVYIFQKGSGKDTIIEDDATYSNTDVVKFGAGITSDNLKFNRIGNDLQITIEGATDTLTISNYYKNQGKKVEKLVLDDGTIISSDRYDTLALYGTEGNDILEAGDCKDTVMALAGGDTIYGFGGDDTIYAASGNDMLYGGVGNDVLNGEDGDDTLNGQEGNDSLVGGIGNDTYVFELGSGIDNIYNYSTLDSDIDTIEFGVGISTDRVSFTRLGDDLQIILLGTSDRLNIKNYYTSDVYKIDYIKFKDGTIWGPADIAIQISTKPAIIGKDTDDPSLSGTSSNDIILGEGGKDIIYGNGGNDILYGGTGDDTLNGGAGDDELNGDEGKDILNGGVGSDTYVFGRGFGQDTINDYDTTRGNIDTIKFIDGITKDDIELTRTNTNLIITIKGTEDSIKILQQFVSAYKIERIIFEDGTVMGDTEFNNVPICGTSGDDSLNGDTNRNIIKTFEGVDTVTAGAGDDEIYGGIDGDFLHGDSGNDIVYGETGADYLYGEEGNDYLYGGEDDDNLDAGDGDDYLYGGQGNDGLEGGTGNDTLIGQDGNDNLNDIDGNDILDGGAGNDNLNGSLGNDTYIYNIGYEQDTINDYDETEGNIDTIKFGAGISQGDLSYKRVLSNLEITFGNTADKLTISDYYITTNNIEVIKFNDESILDNSVVSNLDINGTEGKDIIQGDDQNNVIYGFGEVDQLRGNAGNDIIKGGDGNDYLYGGDGNDTMYGELGADTLEGGAGDDTYVFGLGCGADTITSTEGLDTGTDKLFIYDVNYADIAMVKDNSNLVITIKGTTDSVTAKDYFNGGDNALEEIQFKNGEILNFTDVNSVISGTYISKTVTAYDTTLEKSIQAVGELSDTGMASTSSSTSSTDNTTDLLFNLNS